LPVFFKSDEIVLNYFMANSLLATKPSSPRRWHLLASKFWRVPRFGVVGVVARPHDTLSTYPLNTRFLFSTGPNARGGFARGGFQKKNAN
jgi:hypothetical protein